LRGVLSHRRFGTTRGKIRILIKKKRRTGPFNRSTPSKTVVRRASTKTSPDNLPEDKLPGKEGSRHLNGPNVIRLKCCARIIPPTVGPAREGVCVP